MSIGELVETKLPLQDFVEKPLCMVGRGRCTSWIVRIPVPIIGKPDGDRKSTRLNSSHITISYAVFCLKKKKPIVFYVFTIFYI